jgi:hypothetical protein
LEIANYAAHFYNELIDERQALAEDLEQYNLYEVPLTPILWPTGLFAYRINVPGLREYLPPIIPSIFVGDTIVIRAVYPAQNYFDGDECVAYICGIDREEG